MTDEVGVLYFNRGTGHCARLLVSLYSLRKHCQGSVCILDTGESGGIIEQIEADERLSVVVQRIKIKEYRRHSAYVAKASLWRHSPFPVTLLLDADTAIVKTIDPLLEIVADERNPGFVVTRFADWITTGPTIAARINQWKQIECDGIDVRKLVRLSFEAPYPAINTGVVGMRTYDKRALMAWERLAQAGHRCSWTDELAAQLILRQEKHTLLSDRYNASCIYAKERDKAVIWHAHGRKHLIREDGRGTEADKIWSPLFTEVFAANVGRIRDWAPAGDATLEFNMHRFAH